MIAAINNAMVINKKASRIQKFVGAAFFEVLFIITVFLGPFLSYLPFHHNY